MNDSVRIIDIPQHFKDSLSECSKRIVEGNNKWNLDISFSDDEDDEQDDDGPNVLVKHKSRFEFGDLMNTLKVRNRGAKETEGEAKYTSSD